MSALNFTEGATIGSHRLDVPLGRSATGVVYRAVDLERDRAVALKIVHPDIAADPRYRRRFKREADSVAALHDDNVIQIWRCGEDAGTVYLSMELIATRPTSACCSRPAGWLSSVRSRSPRTSPPRSTLRTADRSCTATSNPRTCSSAPAASASRQC